MSEKKEPFNDIHEQCMREYERQHTYIPELDQPSRKSQILSKLFHNKYFWISLVFVVLLIFTWTANYREREGDDRTGVQRIMDGISEDFGGGSSSQSSSSVQIVGGK